MKFLTLAFVPLMMGGVCLIAPAPISAAEPSEIVDKVIAELGPARNQKDTDLCFSHAAADIISYELGQKVSALSVAIRYFENLSGADYLIFNPIRSLLARSDSSPFMIGFGSEVLESSLKGSLCPDDQPSGQLSYREANLKNLYDTYESIRSTFSPTKPTQLYQKLFEEIKTLHPKSTPTTFEPFIKRHHTLPMALGKWYSQQCHLKLQALKKVKIINYQKLPQRNEIIFGINNALSQNTFPIVHFDTELLYDRQPSLSEKLMGFHVATIVHRTHINNEVYYLLRNTWGSSCKGFGGNIIRRCDRGHFWITEDEINRYFTTVSYYQFQNL